MARHSDGLSSDSSRDDANESLRLPSLPRRPDIVERIVSESITNPHVASYRSRAQFTFFAGAEPESLAGYDGQLELAGRCLEWFVFDYIIPELQATPAEYWLAEHTAGLSRQELDDAGQCMKFILGLFEVDRVVAGSEFLARNLLSPSLSCKVAEPLITKEIQNGQLLLGRIFPHRSRYVLSGMAAMMDTRATVQIKSLIAEGVIVPSELAENMDGLGLENLFGRRLDDIETTLTADVLERRIKYYLEQTCGGSLAFDEFSRLIDTCSDPVNLAADLAEQLEICCRHEMDLFFCYVRALWRQRNEDY